MKEDGYLQSKDGKIYKIMSTHLLQLSPWKDGDDRRLYEYNDKDMTVITYQNACMIVNKQFTESDEEWEHNGKKYKARAITNKNIDEHTAMLSMLPSHYIKESTRVLKTLPNDNSITINVGQEAIIDIDKLLCYREGVNLNTTVNGDISKLVLQEGINAISITDGFELYIKPGWRELT